jgi:hypothetical protein
MSTNIPPVEALPMFERSRKEILRVNTRVSESEELVERWKESHR